MTRMEGSQSHGKERSLGKNLTILMGSFFLLCLAVGVSENYLLNGILKASKDSYAYVKVEEISFEVGTSSKAFLNASFASLLKPSVAERHKLKDDLEIEWGGVDEFIMKLEGQAITVTEIQSQTTQVVDIWKTLKPKGDAWLLEWASPTTTAATLSKGLFEIQEELAKIEQITNKLKVLGTEKVGESYAKSEKADKFKDILSVILFGCLIGLTMYAGIFGKKITSRCRFLIHQIGRRTSALMEHSNTLTSGSQKLSEACTEQAAAIQESMSAMEEMSSMIQNTTQYAEHCNQITSKVEGQTKQGVMVMRDMVSAMEAIEESNTALSGMTLIIEKIFERTNVINDIVFKTQLLSFNASIEAARAGQYGKGFAVVAEEVGKLAEMSGGAAKEISQLLGESRREVLKIVEGTTKRVQGGKLVSKTALEAFEGIAVQIDAITQQVADISRAAKEQSIGVQQVSEAMKEMDKASLQNNIVAGEVAKLAQTIKLNCNDYNVIVGGFRSTILGSTPAPRAVSRSNQDWSHQLSRLSSDHPSEERNVSQDEYKEEKVHSEEYRYPNEGDHHNGVNKVTGLGEPAVTTKLIDTILTKAKSLSWESSEKDSRSQSHSEPNGDMTSSPKEESPKPGRKSA
jgi:hypothetical protein